MASGPSTCAEGRARRGLAFLIAVSMASSAAGPARAEPDPGDDTFRYVEPQEAHPARATAWSGIYLGLQLVSYLSISRPPGALYETTYTPWDKLTHGAVSFDANAFRTNFVAHPFMGATLYQLARGGRESAWLASLSAAAGSTAWELMEFHEKASINDLIVTPVAGIALGEPLFQLAAHLDRSPPSTTRTVLAWLSSPWKKVNDAVDGATPARGRPDDTLEARLGVGSGGVSTSEGRRPELWFSGGWRLWRDAEYGAPGNLTRAWLDGQATGLSASVATGPHGVTDARFQSSALLAALYARSIDADGRGTDLVAGLGPGFELRGHAWTHARPFDFGGMVEIPRGTLEGRWLAGTVRLTLRVDAALVFGGARAFVLDGDPGAAPFDTLPTVQQQFGYHFGLGGSIRPSAELTIGAATLSAAWRADGLGGLDTPDPVTGHHPTARLAEGWSEASLRATWRVSGSFELGADAGWRRRWGRADDTSLTASERSIGVTLGLVD